MEKNVYKFDRMKEELDMHGNPNAVGYSEPYVNNILARIHEIGKELDKKV